MVALTETAMPAVRAVSGPPSAVRGLPTSGRAWMLPGAGEANSTLRRVHPVGAGSRRQGDTSCGGAAPACQNKYMPDVDPNRFVHPPPPLWVEHNGGAYEPTEMERGLWSAASAGTPKMMQLATEMEQRLSEAVSTTNPALEDRTLVEKLEALSGSGWAILND